MLYLAGAALALILTMIGVPALAFALGMFIPLELNTPLLVGGLISWYVASRSGSERGKKARRERGTLIASGFIAGGALMGGECAAQVFRGRLVRLVVERHFRGRNIGRGNVCGHYRLFHLGQSASQTRGRVSRTGRKCCKVAKTN